MELRDKVGQSPDVVSREVGSEVVLLDLASATYFGLNAVGVRVWSFLAGESRSLSEICDMLVMEFDVDEEDAERDVIALANDLLKHGLLIHQAF